MYITRMLWYQYISAKSQTVDNCPDRSFVGSDLHGTLMADQSRIVDMGVPENSVPLNPMVNDHYPY